MLSVTYKPFVLSAIMLNIIMLSAIMLNVVMLTVVMLVFVMPCPSIIHVSLKFVSRAESFSTGYLTVLYSTVPHSHKRHN